MSNPLRKAQWTLKITFFIFDLNLNTPNWPHELSTSLKLEQIVIEALVGHRCRESSLGLWFPLHQNECRPFWPLPIIKYSLCRVSPVVTAILERIPKRESKSIPAAHLFNGNFALWVGNDLISSGCWYRVSGTRFPSLHSDLSYPSFDFSERRTYLERPIGHRCRLSGVCSDELWSSGLQTVGFDGDHASGNRSDGSLQSDGSAKV